MDAGNDHVLAYFRQHLEQSVLVLANFSEEEQEIEALRLRQLGLRRTLTDLVAGKLVIATETLKLEPYQVMVLVTSADQDPDRESRTTRLPQSTNVSTRITVMPISAPPAITPAQTGSRFFTKTRWRSVVSGSSTGAPPARTGRSRGTWRSRC